MNSVDNSSRGRCIICGQEMNYAFTCMILRKYDGVAASCPHCGFLQIVNPHWLTEAYSDAIASCDTGLVARNLLLATRLNPLLFYLFGTSGRYIDFAGGTGLFVRLMRDAGYDFYWNDPYCANVHARGFVYEKGIECRAVTAFEVLEHVTDPVGFVSNIFEETSAHALFFTTELFSGLPPEPAEWWYYAFDAGQHISFYQKKSLEIVAERLGKKFASNDGIHVLCDPPLFDQLQRYYNSSLIKRFARYKSSRILVSKTMSDHHLLLAKGKVPE